MKDEEFIKAALVEMNKIYKIRKEIIPVKVLNECEPILLKHRTYSGRFLNEREIKLKDLGASISVFNDIRYRFKSWSRVGVGKSKEDKRVVEELQSFVKYLDICIGNQYTNREKDSILQEVKEKLEALILMAKLINVD